MGDATMEVEVWQGDWGLPSIDHHCLAVMAYCKFSEVPVKFSKSNNPWNSPSGELPVLKHDEGSETKVIDIFNYLRKHNWGTDYLLSTKQCADIVAFSAMLEEKLLPALLHLWWVDARNYLEFTRPWFSKALPFPLNFYMPMRKHKEYSCRLQETLGVDNMSDLERETKLYRDAKECLNSLSTKLGSKEYFFGDRPSSLDAQLYGYLTPLLKAPFPNTTLQNHLKGCLNLCQLCQHISNKYFPLSQDETEALRKKEEEYRKKQAETSEFPNKRRNLVVAGAVALTAMMGYAFLSGLVSVEVIDHKKKDEEQEGMVQIEENLPEPPNFHQFDNFFQEGGKSGQGEGQESRSQGQEEDSRAGGDNNNN